MTYMKKNLHFFNLKKKRVTDGPTDGPTNGPTDQRTDRPSYRDARTHLKTALTPMKEWVIATLSWTKHDVDGWKIRHSHMVGILRALVITKVGSLFCVNGCGP